jgi:hypothetical protein
MKLASGRKKPSRRCLEGSGRDDDQRFLDQIPLSVPPPTVAKTPRGEG